MRIFFVTNNYTPYSGGIVSSINAITESLQAQGHEVFIITLDFLGKNNKPQAQSAIASATAEPHADPNYVIRIPCPIKFMYKKNYMAIPWRSTHAITQLLKKYKPDIVHVHHPFLLGASALQAAHKLHIPCVFTYHTMYEEYAHYIPLPQFCTKQAIRSMVNRFCNTVDGIIVPSTAIKEYLGTQNITTPITVIPSPLRPIFILPSPARLTPSSILFDGDPDWNKVKIGAKGYHRASNKDPFKLLVVSRFVPEKNIPFVFDVFKKLPDTFTLTLVGYGTDYEKMQSLAFNTLQLSPNRVHFIHKPSQADLLAIYRNADLFIFPSKTDTQGIVIAESMSQGLPVIALDGPGQRDIIVNGTNGFIIKDENDAATTIMEIANNASLHNHLKSGARSTAQHYHADVITAKLLNFYHSICS